MMQYFKKITALFLVILIVSTAIPLFSVSAANNGFDNKTVCTINADDSFAFGENSTLLNDYNGKKAVLIAENSSVKWSVEIPKNGTYIINLSYCAYKGKTSDPELQLFIDGEVVSGLTTFILPRIWRDASDIVRDNRNNDVCPEQVEVIAWNNEYISDTQDKECKSVAVSIPAGKHTIEIASIRESVAISDIRFIENTELLSYEEYKALYKNEKLGEGYVYLKAETPSQKSSPVLTPSADRASPITEPQSYAKIRLNIMDGAKWRVSGQWVEYNFSVKESGLYAIAFRWRQNDARGLYGTRVVSIDGEVPFKEMQSVNFAYSSDWKRSTLSAGDEECLFYLSAGEHTLRFQAVVGSINDIYEKVYDSVQRLNALYREIVMITGTNPDIYRDFELDKKIPDAVAQLKTEANILEEASENMTKILGKSSYTAILDTASYHLNEMNRKPDAIPEKLASMNSYVASLGTWLLNVCNTPLDIDYIEIGKPDKARKSDAGFFTKLWFEICAFLASFIEDYSVIGDQSEATTVIEVWMNSGRDQAQILKSMLESDFTPKTKIGVEVKVVQGALLKATLAGVGPDVALEIGGSEPINYALRGAAYNLAQFKDLDGVLDRFYDAAIIPFEFEGGVYALPETMFFPMLFYRKDILEELKLKVPNTWDDVYKMLPVLQRYNMNFGIPSGDSALTSFGTFLYQNGGSYYNEKGDKAMLGTDISVNSMRQWTQMYTDYGLDVAYDFPSRFRSGQMPIAIAGYTTYNTLTVFAPEIRGQWEFTVIPGTLKEDGTIDRSTPATVNACMIMGSTDQPKESWEFLKWWTSDETKSLYGRRLESLLGETGRYPAANKSVISEMPWTMREVNELEKQLKSVVGIPEVAGGYFTWRHLENAFRAVINDGDDPRETMLEYNDIINEEISIKRKELGLK